LIFLSDEIWHAGFAGGDWHLVLRRGNFKLDFLIAPASTPGNCPIPQD
jgi:hypothetical protein